MGMASWNMLVSPTLKIGHHANSKVSRQGEGGALISASVPPLCSDWRESLGSEAWKPRFGRDDGLMPGQVQCACCVASCLGVGLDVWAQVVSERAFAPRGAYIIGVLSSGV